MSIIVGLIYIKEFGFISDSGRGHPTVDSFNHVSKKKRDGECELRSCSQRIEDAVGCSQLAACCMSTPPFSPKQPQIVWGLNAMICAARSRGAQLVSW